MPPEEMGTDPRGVGVRNGRKVFSLGSREGLSSSKVKGKLRPEPSEGGSQADIWEVRVSSRGDSSCQGPEGGECSTQPGSSSVQEWSEGARNARR